VSKQLWKPAEKPTGNPRDLRSVIMFFIMLIAIVSVLLLFVLDKTDGVTIEPLVWSYNQNKAELQNAVTGYATDHNGSLPTLNGIYTNANCSNCNVINISALVVANDGMLRLAPDGLHLSPSGNDNCGGNASLGCSSEGSYIWLVDTNGSVYSYCAGTKCPTNNSGYQDVWP
jgi:hypothetical protein